MCEEWWTEAKNADEKSGIPARGTAAKQRQFICKNSVGVPVDQNRMKVLVSSGKTRHPRIPQQTKIFEGTH